MALTPALIEWLESEAGVAAAEFAAALPPDTLGRITKLRARATPERAAAVVELLALRERGRAKFPNADRMYFTAEGLEQSTSAPVAAYRASRFPASVPVADLSCGIGGDALALAASRPVLAVDINPAAAACAVANARALDIHLNVLVGDAMRLDLGRLRSAGIGAVMLDPSRRISTASGRSRVRSPEDYTPPLSWARALAEAFPFVAIKLSPFLDDHVLQGWNCKVEFLSHRGECKEAVLWLKSGSEEHSRVAPRPPSEALERGAGIHPRAGAYSAIRDTDWHGDGWPEGYTATVIADDGTSITLRSTGAPPAEAGTPLAYLLEPDPAVIRAHLTDEIAAAHGALRLDPAAAFLTSGAAPDSPFVSAYRIRSWMPFNLKRVREEVRRQRLNVETVKKRGVPLDVDEIRRALRAPASSDGDRIVLVLGLVNGKPAAIFCDPKAT